MRTIYLILLSSFSILFIILGFYPNISLFWSKTKTYLLSARIYGTLILVSIFILPQCESKKNAENKVTLSASSDRIQFDKNGNQIASVPIKKNYTYKILKSHDKHPELDNFAIELHTSDISKENIEAIAKEIKTELCTRDCNIALYDDKKYYDMEKRMTKEEESCIKYINSNQKDCLDAIAKKYYVKIADHLLGYLDFSEGTFLYYPYRDWHYKELGGKL